MLRRGPLRTDLIDISIRRSSQYEPDYGCEEDYVIVLDQLRESTAVAVGNVERSYLERISLDTLCNCCNELKRQKPRSFQSLNSEELLPVSYSEGF